MKTKRLSTFKYLIMLLAVAMLGQGCSENKNIPAQNGPAQPILPPNATFPPGAFPGNGPGTNGDSWNYGATADFSPVSLQVMNTYVSERPLNNPQNIKINVNLVDAGGGKYAGHIKISYYDNGERREGYFTSGTGYNTVNGNKYYGYHEAEFNRWFNHAGKVVFHGFFEDRYGAIILVIDDGLDLGDGGGVANVSGSIWFKNFSIARAPESPTECWFVENYYGGTTPYDCRTFLVNNVIQTSSALYPSDGYTKLGTFSNLDKAKAFNE